jgi:CheY-like chemotaxis protein/HPt (histidine-containing phosphotransfer) domain-containing protein
MGGECGVSSHLGTGSTFWFTICMRVVTHFPLAPSTTDPDLDGVTILVVDDNATQRRVLSGYLADWGMTVRTAESAPAALATLRTAAIQNQPFAVALVDRGMPGLDGLGLTNAIVVDPALSPRLVLMTSLGEHAEQGTAALPGIDGCVSKPVHREDLRSCIRMALRATAGEAPPGVVDGQPIVPTPLPSPREGFETGRLLLAEDNPINQKVAIAMLSSAGYIVDTVSDGAAAVKAAATQAYDAILMDCQMPELNGYEATAAIRAHERAVMHTPIIAMTAGARPEDRVRCLDAGMDHYLAKPISKDVLLAMVARSVTNGPAAQSPPLRAPGDSEGEVTLDSTMVDELQGLEGTTESGFLAELLEQFVEQTDLSLAALRDALQAGDTSAVSHIAQNIRGGGAQLGGRRLALSCSRLERRAAAGAVGRDASEVREIEFDYQELCRTLTLELALAPAVANDELATLDGVTS